MVQKTVYATILLAILSFCLIFDSADGQRINIDCPASISILDNLTCTISTTGIPAIYQIYLGLGDGGYRLYNLSDYYPPVIYPYNYSFPYNYSNTTVLDKTSNPITFFLLNTEFLHDGALISFELQSGTNHPDTIELYNVVLDGCPDTSLGLVSCTSLLANLSIDSNDCPSFTPTFITKQTVSKGYNKLTIPSFLVKKGSFLMIKSNVSLVIDPVPVPDPYHADIEVVEGPGNQCAMTSLSAQRILFNYEYAPSIQYPVTTVYDVPDVYTLMVRVLTTSVVQTLDVSVNPLSELFVDFCNFPEMYMPNRAKYATMPNYMPRANLFSILTYTIYNCNVTFFEEKTWEVNQVDPESGNVTRRINMSDNASIRQSELVLAPLTFDYGTYQFIYQVILSANTTDGFITTDPLQLSTFFEIVTTGIAVYALPVNMRKISRGLEETIVLDPRKYSFDRDMYFDASLLTYTHYCRIIENDIPFTEIQNLTYLQEYPALFASLNPDPSRVCFNGTSLFSIDSNFKLTISPGGLPLNEQRTYEFTIETVFKGQIYSQTFYIIIRPYDYIPGMLVGCKFLAQCWPYETYQRVNPDTQLLVYGKCDYGCDNLVNTTSIVNGTVTGDVYLVNKYFEIFMNIGTTTSPSWTTYQDIAGYVNGQNSSELTISKSLWNAFTYVSNWRVEYFAEILLNGNLYTIGSSGIIIKTNNLPYNGFCVINRENGTAAVTNFIITCMDWEDSDGLIDKFEYAIRPLSKSTRSVFGYSKNGILNTYLPAGLALDNYFLELTITVYDDNKGTTTFTYPNFLNVKPNPTIGYKVVTELAAFDPGSTLIQSVRGGNIATVVQNIMTYATIINQLAPQNAVPSTLANMTDSWTNLVADAREVLFQALNNVSVATLTSVKMIACTLEILTNNTDQITGKSALYGANTLGNLGYSMSIVHNATSIEDLKEAAQCAMVALDNIQYAVSGPTNNRKPFLDADLKNSTTSSNSFDDQKLKTVEAMKNAVKLITAVAEAIGSHMAVNQSHEINTESMKYSLKNSLASEVNGSIYLTSATINGPSFCSLAGLTDEDCASTAVTQKLVETKNPVTGKNGDKTGIGSSNCISIGYLNSNQTELKIKDIKVPVTIVIKRNTSVMIGTGFLPLNVTTLNATNRTQFATFGLQLTGNNISYHVDIKPANPSLGYIFILKFGGTPMHNTTSKDYDLWNVFCPNDLKTDNGIQYYSFFANMATMRGFNGYVGYALRQIYTGEMPTTCPGNSLDPSLTAPPATDLQCNFTAEVEARSFQSGCYYYDHSKGIWASDGVEVLPQTSINETYCNTTHYTDFAGGFIVLPPAIDFNYVFANASFDKNKTIYITVIVISCLYILLAVWCRVMDRKDLRRTGVTPLADNEPADNYFYEIIVYTGTRSESATDSKVSFILSGDAGETQIRRLDDAKRRIFRRGGIDSFIMSNKKPLGDLTYLRIWHDNCGKGQFGSWFLKFIIVHDLQTRQKFYFICDQWLALERGDGQIERFLPACGDAQKTEFKYLLSKQAKQKMSDGHLWFSVMARPTQSSFTRLDRLTVCYVLLCMSMLMNILYYGVDKSPKEDGLKIGPLNITPQQISIGVITNLCVFPPSFLLVQLFRRSRKRVSRTQRLKKTISKIKEDNKKIIASKPRNAYEDPFTSMESARSSADLFSVSRTPLPNEMAAKAQGQYNPYIPYNPFSPFGVQTEKEIAEMEKLKKKKKLSFPWWVKIIAYMLAFVFGAVSLFFIIMQGISLGDEQCTKWITSLAVSFVASVLLTQPIQVALMSLLVVTVCRKNSDADDLEIDADDDGKALNDDEMWLHEINKRKEKQQQESATTEFDSNDYNNQNFLKHSCNQYDEEELEALRLKRLKEVKIRKILREILFYSIFLWVLYIVAFLNNDANLANYQNSIKTYFSSVNSQGINFDAITFPTDIFIWAQGFADSLYATSYYNGAVNSENYLVSDFTSMLVGYPILRQHRVVNNTGKLNKAFNNIISFCLDDYGVLSREKENFTAGWNQPLGVTADPTLDYTLVNQAFNYTSADVLDSLPFMGTYTTYLGGGYIYNLIGSSAEMKNNLTWLQNYAWIDRQTRAVTLEFSVYNPNINLFCHVIFLLEILPSGNIIKTSKFTPLRLFERTDDAASFKLACNLIYLAFIIYYIIKQIALIRRQKCKYFASFWSYVELLIIGFSWAAFSMFLYRMYAADKLLNLFKNYSRNNFVNLQNLSYMNDALTFCLAFCAALGTIKFLKLLRFNRRISLLGETLKHCAKDLITFSVIFIVFWLAFVQLFYLTFNEQTLEFATVVRSMATCFQMMLGKFDVQPMWDANKILGPLFFASYNIVIVMILLNMFFSIVTDSFGTVRQAALTAPETDDDAHVFDYLFGKIKSKINKVRNKVDQSEQPAVKYKDALMQFPDSVTNLVTHLDKLRYEYYQMKAKTGELDETKNLKIENIDTNEVKINELDKISN